MEYGLFTYRPGGERRLLGVEEIKDDDREVYGRAFVVHPIDNQNRSIETHIDYLYIEPIGGSLYENAHVPIPSFSDLVAA